MRSVSSEERRVEFVLTIAKLPSAAPPALGSRLQPKRSDIMKQWAGNPPHPQRPLLLSPRRRTSVAHSGWTRRNPADGKLPKLPYRGVVLLFCCFESKRLNSWAVFG